MIDPRFRQFAVDEVWKGSLRAKRDEFIKRLGPLDDFIRRLGVWWLQITEKAMIEKAGAKYLSDAVIESLVEAAPSVPRFTDGESEHIDSFNDALIAVLLHACHVSNQTPAQEAAALVLSRAIGYGVSIAESPSATLFNMAENATAGVDDWAAFNKTFAGHLAEDKIKRQQWIDALKKFPSDPARFFMAGSTQHGSDGGREAFRESSAFWTKDKSPFNLWFKGQWDLHVQHEPAEHLFALVYISPRDFMLACDELPTPPVVRIFSDWPVVFQDPDLVRTLLEEAATCIDSNPMATGHPAILFATELVLRYAKSLFGTVSNAASPHFDRQRPKVTDAAKAELERLPSELEVWFRESFSTLLLREDGLQVASVYLAHLLDQRLWHGSKEKTNQIDVTEMAIKQLTTSLAEKILASEFSVRVFGRIWQHYEEIEKVAAAMRGKRELIFSRQSGIRRLATTEGPGAQVTIARGLPFLLAAVAVAAQCDEQSPEYSKGGFAKDDRAGLRAWYEQLLVARDPAIWVHELARVEETARSFGDVFSDDPGAWHEIWTKLAPQRRRVMHWHFVEENDAADPSLFHLFVGFSVFDEWHGNAKTQGEKGRCREFLDKVYSAARQLWLVTTIDPQNNAAQILNYYFARVPYLRDWFPPQDGFLDWVSNGIGMLGGDLEAIPYAMENLLKNGLQVAELRNCFSRIGRDVEETLASARRWYENGVYGGVPTHLENLEQELA